MIVAETKINVNKRMNQWEYKSRPKTISATKSLLHCKLLWNYRCNDRGTSV